jgi:NADPH-ferrihemoprotein reductase
MQEEFGDEKDPAVFLVSTFGEGDPPDSAVEFHKWLMSPSRVGTNLPTTYAVFALGNRQYEHFCKCGIDFDARLHELGGIRLLDVGLGDDGMHHDLAVVSCPLSCVLVAFSFFF